MVAKRKSVVNARVTRSTLRSALVNSLKKDGGRKDIKIGTASHNASKRSDTLPIEQRAGFPVKLGKGCVHPKNWETAQGVKIVVDFSRAKWLPDDWGQGIKITQATSRSTGTGGGILTTFVAPDGKSYFHKHTSEQYNGKGELSIKDGWNGQVRLAKAQAHQQLELARAEGSNGGQAKDESLFKLLSAAERKCLPSKDVLHVGIVSARRATKLEGIRDIFMVQSQFEEAGVTPTWYVDEGSVKDYRALGLKVVVGGKLCEARTKVLVDARRQGKVCVQASDDITAWEYRDGPPAKVRTDDAMNAAHAAAKRLIISPVAAARFILAKMRGAEGVKPKLGGVYMLGSCARAFVGEAFVRKHFILGDFFVVEPDSKLNFDAEMKLKEDYDFTASHINKYGSVMRCNRMTLNVKHYSNGGGACTNRDKKGEEEKRNVDILHRKWPRCFRANPKRKGEVIMCWKDAKNTNNEDEDGDKSAATSLRKGSVGKVKKAFVKKAANFAGLSPDAIVSRTDKKAKSSYIDARCAKAAGKTVRNAVANVSFKNQDGTSESYKLSDLRYDLKCGYLSLKRSSKGR